MVSGMLSIRAYTEPANNDTGKANTLTRACLKQVLITTLSRRRILAATILTVSRDTCFLKSGSCLPGILILNVDAIDIPARKVRSPDMQALIKEHPLPGLARLNKSGIADIRAVQVDTMLLYPHDNRLIALRKPFSHYYPAYGTM
jgi:hypothetical protein